MGGRTAATTVELVEFALFNRSGESAGRLSGSGDC